jgi:NAD(P)-dependent dehydrogenase (short-subunit alcohol dehydrogenase family)
MSDPSKPLHGRLAVVTGGHRGIGRAISVALAAAGAAVVVGSRNPDDGGEVVDEIERAGGTVAVLECDVTRPRSVAQFALTVIALHAVADIVVANAGIAGPTLPIHEITLAQWRECIATDLDGVFLTFKSFLPSLIERGNGGSLISIGSVTGKRPQKGRTPYGAAKMGVIGLVRSLAEEVGPYGIRANVISPGPVDGPRLRSVLDRQADAEGMTTDQALARFVEPAAMKRVTYSSEVAAACVFLASDASAAITGVDLNVAAGLVMY